MKTAFSFLLFLFGFGVASILAKVITVDNNTVLAGSPGQYSNLQTAITAANSGDTILIEGSPNSYGAIYIQKKITLIGPGFNPQSRNTHSAQVSDLMLDVGSGSSVITGLSFGDISTNPNTSALISNITIRQNEITSANGIKFSVGNTYSNIKIYNNIINTTGWPSTMMVIYGTNITISNNIFINTTIYYSNQPSVIIANNLFLASVEGTPLFWQVTNAEVKNNIIKGYGIYDSIYINSSAVNCTFNNNICYLCQPNNYTVPFGSNVGSGNILETDPLFQNESSGTFSYKSNYMVTASSPCKNAGTDGTDIGPSGGAYPFTTNFPLTGMPSIPFIKQMFINGPSSVATGNFSINITVKAEKQN